MPDFANRQAVFRTRQIDEEGQEYALDLQQANDILKSNSDAVSEVFPSLSMVRIPINLNRKPFSDVRVRQAISMGIDCQAFIDTLAFGKGKPTGNVPPLLTGWGLQPDQLGQYYQRNVTKAKQLLADTGYPNGFTLELLVTPQYGTGIVNGSVMLQDQLEDIGLTCEIRQAEYAAYLKEFQGGTFKDIIIAPQGAPIEVDECIYSIFHSQSAKNYVHLKDDNLDAMLAKQRQTIDDAERKKQVVAIQNYLNEQLYVIGVFVSSSAVVWQPYLKGFRPHAFGSYAMHMWQDVWLQKQPALGLLRVDTIVLFG